MLASKVGCCRLSKVCVHTDFLKNMTKTILQYSIYKLLKQFKFEPLVYFCFKTLWYCIKLNTNASTLFCYISIHFQYFSEIQFEPESFLVKINQFDDLKESYQFLFQNQKGYSAWKLTALESFVYLTGVHLKW